MPGLQPVVMGSHLDTVYQGGKYDGVVGVTAALEVIKRLNERSIVTEHPIEIIAFACEESSRFGVSTVGSKAMAGLIDKEKYRHLVDRDGITMEQAFAHCGLDFSNVDQATRVDEGFHAFFELHIEQGPLLINYEKKIGIVTGGSSTSSPFNEVKWKSVPFRHDSNEYEKGRSFRSIRIGIRIGKSSDSRAGVWHCGNSWDTRGGGRFNERSSR